jgi:polyhydroxybutyrate depolymerase
MLRYLLVVPFALSFLMGSSHCLAQWLRLATERQITVDGHERKYFEFIPKGAKPPVPVVLALHGGRGNGRQMERYTRLNGVAEKHGFLVIYPESLNGNWKDGRDLQRVQQETADDVKYLRSVVEDVGGRHKINRGRIFATGVSNGAFMSHRLVAEASDVIAAIAPVIGGMAPSIAKEFGPQHPVSILIIQGDADPLVPINGGGVGLGRIRRGRTVPTKETLGRYLKLNGNKGEPAVTKIDADPDDGTTVEMNKYPDGPGGFKTHYCLVKNGGHAWPGRPQYLPDGLIGKASQDFFASEMICEFFKGCPPRANKKSE